MEDNVKRNLDTDWWFNYQEFYKMIASKNYDIVVELGVWKGHSVTFLANQIKKLGFNGKIYAVDLWGDSYQWTEPKNKKLKSQVPVLYDIYTEVKKRGGVMDMITDLKGMSWEMAEKFEDGTVDFVFIDADHKYESVVKDIKAWLPKMREGGIISGHDYNNPCGVKQAVDTHSHRTIWTINKYVCDEKDDIIVDTLLDFENLNDDFIKLNSRLGLTEDSLPYINRTNSKSFRKVMDEEVI
jgi:predicted O-methyltransferase YrrM